MTYVIYIQMVNSEDFQTWIEIAKVNYWWEQYTCAFLHLFLCKSCADVQGGLKKWHSFGIWVSVLVWCIVFAIFVYSGIICITWRHH